MKFPKTLAAWCIVLFFLVFGIVSFWSFQGSDIVLGILALGAAILTFIGK